jgi:hypothetical protein
MTSSMSLMKRFLAVLIAVVVVGEIFAPRAFALTQREIQFIQVHQRAAVAQYNQVRAQDVNMRNNFAMLQLASGGLGFNPQAAAMIPPPQAMAMTAPQASMAANNYRGPTSGYRPGTDPLTGLTPEQASQMISDGRSRAARQVVDNSNAPTPYNTGTVGLGYGGNPYTGGYNSGGGIDPLTGLPQDPAAPRAVPSAFSGSIQPRFRAIPNSNPDVNPYMGGYAISSGYDPLTGLPQDPAAPRAVPSAFSGSIQPRFRAIPNSNPDVNPYMVGNAIGGGIDPFTGMPVSN